MEGCPDFINFIEHNDRIRGAHSLHGLNKLSGHGTDIGSAVSFNLCFVSHSPQGKAKKLAAQCLGHTHSHRGLADTRGADKTEDGACDIPFDLPHCQKLQNSSLHVFQSIVVTIEDLSGPLQIVVVLTVFSPR